MQYVVNRPSDNLQVHVNINTRKKLGFSLCFSILSSTGKANLRLNLNTYFLLQSIHLKFCILIALLHWSKYLKENIYPEFPFILHILIIGGMFQFRGFMLNDSPE